MELRRLGTLLCLQINLCTFWNVQGHPTGSQENVIDLLAALNISHPMKGISRIQGDNPGTHVYKLRHRAPHLTLLREYSHFLVSSLQGTMGVHLVGRQAHDSGGTLLSLSSQSSPVLQMLSSTRGNTLRLDYQAGAARAPQSLLFPGGNPFSGGNWVHLALGLEPERVTLFLDCQEVIVLQRKSEDRINLELPPDLVVTLASTDGEDDSKFSGYLKTAQISMAAYQRRPWHCANITDALPPSPPTRGGLSLDSSDSKHRPFPQLQDLPSPYPREVQNDQPQRGVVLGPPSSPQGGGVYPQTQEEQRVRGLEERLEQLARMLHMVKAQNADLQSRVHHLEGCDCVRRGCVWEGREVEDGQRWQAPPHTVCTCASGRVTCEADIKASFQMAAPPYDPCLSSPCHNGGLCLTLTSDPTGFRCSCPPNTKGPLCHRQLRQACWEPRPEKNCQGRGSFQRRWAFNPTSGLCEDFLYCSGNSNNNFPSYNACREQCMMGACCLRKLKLESRVGQQDRRRHEYNISDVDRAFIGYDQHDSENESWYGNIDFNLTNTEALRENDRKKVQRVEGDCKEDSHFTYSCEYLSRLRCQALVKDLAEGAEAVSFSPGERCSEVSCGQGCGCLPPQPLSRYGQMIRLGCEECVSKLDSVCTHITQRKEIRDLTVRERKFYQRAIRRLHTKPAVWEAFTQLRAEFAPQAGGPAYFLPWHRYFLRLVERELQSLSTCQLGVPYFEWTVDSGSMKSSAAWQAGLYGGDGEPGSGCVPHHPFSGWTSRSRWTSCLRRSFNSSVWLPDAVAIQKIVNLDDFQLFSQSLQAISGLFRLWVGGHMASPLAAYDPLFFSHMAFMDKLWTQWQEKHQPVDGVTDEDLQEPRDNRVQNDIDHPALRRHVKMKPFDVAPGDVSSSKHQLCVVYVPITIGAPCNVTSSQIHPQRTNFTDDPVPTRFNRSGFDKRSSHHGGVKRDGRGFDPQGYDRDGYDHSGWDRWGYGRGGFNRDFIDREGYDVSGFNRYGFNRSNVSWFGLHWNGMFKREGEENDGKTENDPNREADKLNTLSGLFGESGYSVYGFDPLGFDRDGFDAFGFQTDGYDKDYCNWFFNGPHYLRFYFHTQQQLLSSSAQALYRIARTCPPITSLPRHWAMQDWMALDPQDSSVLISQLEQEWAEQQKSDSVMGATPNGEDIWLPVTPDDRPIAMVTPRLFVTCTTAGPVSQSGWILSRGSTLYATAGCELDGIPQNVSYNTIDGCQTCTCRGGNRECLPVPCPPLDCTEKETVPTACCPRCRGCIHSGIQYEHRAKWRPPEIPCEICYCLEGRVICEKERCQMPCENPSSPPPNACCHVCDGCGVNGHDFPNGAQIPTGDRCQTCTCVNGNVECSPLPCPSLPCQRPVHRPGDCCPRCEQCEHESQVYLDGQDVASRSDPCLRCRCSAGEVSCERMEASCPTLRCSHPAKTREHCCPSCQNCEYDRRIYADGQLFTPAGSGPCLQCRCKGGNVICHEERCPPVQCSNPIIDPHLCCPICKVCVLEGVEYEEGSQWHPESPCSKCSCVDGEAVCTHTQCPPTDCLHPSKSTGSCCAVCESCTYKQRIYRNGQRFTAPEQPCYICTCQDGTVECERRSCPPLNCTNPQTPPGECCPQCPDCSFENRIFVDGEAFPNPVSVCERCVCVDGRVDCHPPQCPRPNCNAPVPGTCCQNNCNGCRYAGKEYPNGQEFPHPTDKCRTCNCINGNVQCLMKRCPPPKCSNPNLVPGDCCPQCPAPPLDCVYERRPYRHTERFYDPADACRSCLCINGTVQCQRKPCPAAPCSHPIRQDCCRTCEGCLYEGREHANGETWDDPSDSCSVCVCHEGSVQCEKKRCPPSNCNFPIQRKCCMTCDGCTYNGHEYPDSSDFVDGDNPCGICSCWGGDVVCTEVPCYDDCRHPYTPPGQCCGECELNYCNCELTGCFYNNVVLTNGQSIPDPSNPCAECTCERGSVLCVKRECPTAACPHPAKNPCGCAVCEGCQYQGVSYIDGQVLPGGKGGCEDCRCSTGEVVCVQKQCPAVACSHPALDSCACGVCDGCHFTGRDCFNGERFPHPTDHCQLCSCLNGGVVCAPVSCPSVQCTRPVTPPGECCPLCTGTCLHDGQEHRSGSSFRDSCSTCTCLNEVVTCHKRPCPSQCSHPVPSEGCCPACDSCLYEGAVHPNRHAFSPPSSPDRCQRCSCLQGSVTCVPLLCPSTPCARPVTRPGQCCPQCTVCMLDGWEYSDGQKWAHTSNACSTCTCQEGEVQCVSPECPKLTCMHQVMDPGACCPRCRGCIYGGGEHPEGSSWFSDSATCMSCLCVDGVTTCSEVRCLSPCVNTMRVPGECCPVCADCLFEGKVYGPGDSFHPTDDPCQICTCEVMPDGEQHLKCYRKQCPSLVDCPKNNILFSGPDACCPVCAQPLSNCTATIIGNEVLATDDPCFTCQCRDLTWTCLHQSCLPLTCPPNEQFTPPDSCCPVCEDCVIEGHHTRVASGDSWTDSADDCVTCTCNLGHIECSIEECVSLVCLKGQIQVKNPGKCCYECQDSEASCTYQGTVYHPNEQWEVDECTGCSCVSGDVHCHSERCSPLTCAADEMPAVVPGVCCPHCLPRPATCIAFGDPHYRTFDGRMLHFQGACTYVLAQDCADGDFSIQGTNDDRGRKGVSWTKEVTVFIGDVAVQLLQDWVVKVNGNLVTLPFLQEPYIYVERQTNTILLNTNIGLKVLWSGRSHLEISLPGSYRSRTCGLCGNFNNYPQDDFRMPSGRISLSEAAFGNSWRVENRSLSSSCRDGEDINPCKDAGYQARKGANARCKVLKSGAFKPCHRVVPPEPWYGACVYDLCACGANTDECLCDALEAYAGQCREAGVVLQWRSPSLCAVGCPTERGFVFDECGPPCPVNCFNVDVPLGVIESHCFKPCVPGCQCPAGLVLHNNYCIPPEKCPKVIHGNSS